MPTPTTWSGKVEPDYFQFYVRRSDAEIASADVSEAGYLDRLWTNGRFVYVGTRRKFGTTSIHVTVLDQPPGAPSAEWQHVAEASLEPGGPIEVLSWGADQPVAVIPVPEEVLRMRVCWAGLVSDRFEGMDAHGESDERLAIEIWPSPRIPPAVVRRWDGWPW